MFATAIIVFREVIEAALVVGILAAATRSVPGRSRWLAAGVAAGLAGAMVVALGIERIADLASGMGQELFNATTLGIAVVMLAWHNLWMSANSATLAADARNAGRAISDGRRECSILLVIVALASGGAAAGPADYVYMPAVTYGEREIDLKYGAASKKDEPSQQAASLGFGYGATEWWFTEFYVKGEREGASNRFDAIEWENKFQLTETGKYPVDVGFILEFELPHDRSEGNEFRFGPLFQSEIERLQLNFNPLLTNVSRSVEDNGTYLGYQWQAKYRWRQAFEFGAQGFGEMGRWNQIPPTSEQSHRMGPAVFGKINLGGGQVIVWNAALLFGLTAGSPDRNFRMQVEYEF